MKRVIETYEQRLYTSVRVVSDCWDSVVGHLQIRVSARQPLITIHANTRSVPRVLSAHTWRCVVSDGKLSKPTEKDAGTHGSSAGLAAVITRQESPLSSNLIMVSWCSWLSHILNIKHVCSDVVPGSSPGEIIFCSFWQGRVSRRTESEGPTQCISDEMHGTGT